MANPPGVNVTVNTPSSSPNTNSPTGTWFVAGYTAGGPSGVAVPVNSIQDFNTYFGSYTNGAVAGRTSTSASLYDSLDVYFREGGIRAYVSRVVGSAGSPAKATCTLGTSFLTLTATGYGAWANSSGTTSTPASPAGLQVSAVSAGSGGFALTVTYNGNQIGQTSPPLFTANDAINWVNSLSGAGVLFAAASAGSGSVPSLTSTPTYYYFAGGVDGTVSVTPDLSTDVTTSLAAFTTPLGSGQVSAPGITVATVWQALGTHAIANNRVALLDAVDASSATTLVSAAQGLQYGGSNALTDSSYAAMFAPWVKEPGIASTTPNTVAPTFTRTVAPTAFAAAKIAASDVIYDCNVPAAGVINGNCATAIDVTTTYSASDRATINAAGVNLIRNINGAVAVYGFRSLATDTNWISFNNVRFRMQIIRDLDVVVEPFVFAEIDGKGQIFARLAGAVSGQCQLYWLRNSLYGVNPSDAFTVNTGPQINTPTTIAAGQLNVQVNLRMAPQAEQVAVTVTKYLVSATLPSY